MDPIIWGNDFSLEIFFRSWYSLVFSGFLHEKDLMVVFGRYPPQFISQKSPAARQNDMWFHKRINSLVL